MNTSRCVHTFDDSRGDPCRCMHAVRPITARPSSSRPTAAWSSCNESRSSRLSSHRAPGSGLRQSLHRPPEDRPSSSSHLVAVSQVSSRPQTGIPQQATEHIAVAILLPFVAAAPHPNDASPRLSPSSHRRVPIKRLSKRVHRASRATPLQLALVPFQKGAWKAV